MLNRLYLLQAFGVFDKYDVSSMYVVASSAEHARSIARKEEPAWRTKIVIADVVCMNVSNVIAKAYTDTACEIYPDDGCGF